MTALATHPVGATRGSVASHLIRSEVRKLSTTNTWWIFGLSVIGTTGLALVRNLAIAYYYLKGSPPAGDPEYALQHNVVTQAANVFTSGQFLGGLFVMLLAILMITNEYHHQTVTTTFLTTPHRTTVILGKFVTAMVASVFFWVITEVLSLISGSIFFSAWGLDTHLGSWTVWQAILLNLMVFALWAVFGVGIGVLIRSQLGATITATILYVVGSAAISLIAELVHALWIKHDWVLTAQVIVPSVAAEIAVSPNKTFPQSPPEWVGVVVLIAYGLVMGAIGTMIMRRRDVS
jgi:ABC-2 type transport system permease protein